MSTETILAAAEAVDAVLWPVAAITLALVWRNRIRASVSPPKDIPKPETPAEPAADVTPIGKAS